MAPLNREEKCIRLGGHWLMRSRWKSNLLFEGPIFPPASSWSSISVTRLGDFLKFLVTKFTTKVAQIISNFLVYFLKTSLLCKNCCGYFLGNLSKHLGYFLLQHLVTLSTFNVSTRRLFALSPWIPSMLFLFLPLSTNIQKSENKQKEAGYEPY